MLFNSYIFIIFFAITLLLTRIIGNWTARKMFLLILSYVFYAAWNPPFVLILWISTIVDWFVSKWLHASTNRHHRIILLICSLSVNLGMLSYFKYGSFFLDNINAVLAATGVSWQLGVMNVVLPVGISFYTFQTLSYTIDVYNRKLRPWNSFFDYALFVTFFPQLVAGPIIRASNFLPQCEKPRMGTRKQIGWGLYLFVIGLFAKMVLADTLSAPIVDYVFNNASRAGFITAWTGTLAFSMQIFYDFFGYSTCAIGVALCLGFDLPDNFRFPYAARGLTDFWKRWHISLSTWLRDYLYIPLGGNRKGVGRTYINLMTTMLLGGLWHGASWMFVIWGGLHGIYLAGERMLCQSFVSKWPFWGNKYGQWFLTLLTFFLVCLTWVFFRADNLVSALTLCKSMLYPQIALALFSTYIDSGTSINASGVEFLWLGFGQYVVVALLSCGSILLHHKLRDSSLESFFGGMNPLVRAFILSIMMYTIFISMTGEDNAFIYFQF